MNQAKKRLILAITLAEQGGATDFVARFAVWLKKQGHEVTVVAGEGEWLVERCARAGIAFVRTRRLKREISPLNDLAAIFELRRLFRSLQADAIHLNSTKMGTVGSIAAKLAGIPNIVYRIGGWVFLEPLSPLRRRAYLLIEQATAFLKDTIICVHPGDEVEAKKQGIRPRKGIVSVANGIDLASFDQKVQSREEARRELRLEDASFVFGTIANFYPAKDLPRYLDACALVAKQEPNARFLIIGEGKQRGEIEATRERLGLSSVVLLPGTRGDAATLLKAFDAFVLPSAKEGMSWSLLEAMAAGLPCVATDVGANAWSLGSDGGWIVPKNDSNALAAAMLKVMHEPDEARRRGALARKRIEEQFPLEKTFQENARYLLQET